MRHFFIYTFRCAPKDDFFEALPLLEWTGTIDQRRLLGGFLAGGSPAAGSLAVLRRKIKIREYNFIQREEHELIELLKEFLVNFDHFPRWLRRERLAKRLGNKDHPVGFIGSRKRRRIVFRNSHHGAACSTL
jgi:hypothetical protein